MVSYHYVKYQKKANDPILGKFSDGRTDGRRTDRRKRVISQDADRLMSSIQNELSKSHWKKSREQALHDL